MSALLFRIACIALLLAPSVQAAEKAAPLPATPPLTIHYYGQSFIFLTTSSGVRIAIDPFSEGSVDFPFPNRLQADVVLVTDEGPDHNASARLFGSPQTFRSITAIGMNNARGLLFKGVETYRDRDQGARHGTNAVFTFKVDGIRFAHLGGLGHPLDASKRNAIGNVDVLFLPIGNQDLSIDELNKMARDLNAKVIVPVEYNTDQNTRLNLRNLDDYLAKQKKIVRFKSPEFTLTADKLPEVPTIYLPTLPTLPQ